MMGNKMSLHISADIWIHNVGRKDYYGAMREIGICFVIASLIVESEAITAKMSFKDGFSSHYLGPQHNLPPSS